MSFRALLNWAAAVTLLTLTYYGAGRLGLSLAYVHPSATAVWAPTGIALAALLVLGPRVWPGVFLGAFLVNVTTSGDALVSLMIAAGNALEAVVGAFLVNRFAHGRRAFESAADAFKYAILAGLIATTVSATVGVASLMLNELAAWPKAAAVWGTWWLGDVGGALIVAPALILWANDFRVRWDQARTVEAASLAALLILFSLATFGKLLPFGTNNYPLGFIVVPLIIWVAYRFGQRETAAATLLLSGIAVWGTLSGYGPFVRESPNESLLLLQVFTAVVAVTGLGIAALAFERQQAEAALRGANEQLRGGLSHLEQRSTDMALFSEMGHLLQGCQTLTEAGTVLEQFVPRLFRTTRGGVYLATEPRGLMEAAVVWGVPSIRQRLFAIEDCWAIRRGRAHHAVPASEAALLCRHLEFPHPSASFCAPMIAHGETVGVLFLGTPPLVPADRLNESVRQFAQTVADGVALTLANLKLQNTLRQQSIRDPLTGLFNRGYFDETLERELQRARRNRSTAGVIMLDIDHFRKFNDTHGRAAGDVLLRQLGSYLQSNTAGEEIACRYGGEEFLLLLPEASLVATRERAETLWKGVKELEVPPHEGDRQPITVSLGVAAYPEHGIVGDIVVRTADTALYMAKRGGRNRVITFGTATEIQTQTKDRSRYGDLQQ